MIKRILTHSLKRSFFLFGPRQVSKNTYALREFKIEYPNANIYIISLIERPRLLDNGVQVLPWEQFLTMEIMKFKNL